jgi:hypothetical protein
MSELGTPMQALCRVGTALNHPVKAGPMWVTYPRKTIDAALDVLAQLVALERQAKEASGVSGETRSGASDGSEQDRQNLSAREARKP